MWEGQYGRRPRSRGISRRRTPEKENDMSSMSQIKIAWTLCNPESVQEIATALEKLATVRGRNDFRIVREDGLVLAEATTPRLAAEKYVGLANFSTHLNLGDERVAEMTRSRDIHVRLPKVLELFA